MVRHMKNHFFEVAALTVVVRSVVDELAGRDRPLKGPVCEVLALVERFDAGEGVTLPELVAAQAGAQSDDALPLKEREQDRAVRWANTAVGNVAWMAQKGRGWQGGEQFIMDAAGYALSSLRTDGVRDHNALEALRKTALAEVSAKPKAPKARRVATKETTPKMPKPVRVRDELLPFLGTMANAHLIKCKALFDPEWRGSDNALLALTKAHQLPCPDAILAFERRYGGLLAADSPGDDADDEWLYGAYACLRSGAHGGAPKEGGDRGILVPVVYSPNDVIYTLDEHGAAWAEDTLEDPAPMPYASDGDHLVARILVGQLAFALAGKGGSIELAGRRGEEAAALLSLAFIPQASDHLGGTWGDARAIVLEHSSENPHSHSRGVDQSSESGPEIPILQRRLFRRSVTRVCVASKKLLATVKMRLS